MNSNNESFSTSLSPITVSVGKSSYVVLVSVPLTDHFIVIRIKIELKRATSKNQCVLVRKIAISSA